MGKMRMIRDAHGTVDGFCLVKSAAVRIDSKGSEYLDMVLTDSDGECVAKLWGYSRIAHGEYEPNDIVKVRGGLQKFKDTEQFRIDRIRKITADDNVDLSGIIPTAPYDPQAMYDELYSTAAGFSDEDLRRIVQYLLRENREELLFFPAGVKLHHATRGGLLHHTVSVLHLAQRIAELYPNLHKDLLFAGAILHDIGKIKELDAGTLGIAGAYTNEGQLLGHINVGMAMIAAAAEITMIAPKTAMLLEHMILSHHGKPEFGSPRLPMFPEAEVLSICDLLDSKMYEMDAALDGVSKDGFSERQWALDNRQLYKID